jgi:predicted DCC family thiol-disulfide oxidoreductase YuxK
MDRAGRFELVPRQTPDLDRRFPQLATSDFNTGMRLVAADGTVSVGADAVYEIARRLPRTRWVAWLYRVPILHSIARAVYKWVAANRYKLAGRCDTGTCEVATPAQRRTETRSSG